MADIVNQQDLSGSPYYDRFDATQDRTMVLFNPDRALQNSELNALQSSFSYYLGALGNAIANDGDKQKGMDFSQDGNNITVKDGSVYLAGKVRNFKQQTVTLNGNGMETVGVRLNQQIITAQDDAALNDPSQNSPSYGSAGADRLQETVELVANDSAAATVYQFNNGVLFNQTEDAVLSKINDVVAKHDFNALGSYRVGKDTELSGFDLSVTESQDDPDNMATLNISGGLAYVQGYEVNKPYATQLQIRKSLDTEQIEDEQHVYAEDTKEYTLSFPNVKTIDLVTAQVQSTIPITHNAQDGTDFIVDNVVSIDNVYTEGTGGKTFIQGQDYNVTGNSIDWSIATGQEPAVNSSYMVTVTYNKTLTGNGVDYTATIGTGVNAYSIISFDGASGSGTTPAVTPKDGGIITITYTPYLFRTDLVTLDKNGTFTIHEGESARQDVVAPPSLVDPLTLTIGTVTMNPNSDTATCLTSAVTNITFAEMNKLRNRLINLEYNEIINSLDMQEIQKNNPLNLRGVLTDSFTSLDKYDENYDNTNAGVSNPFKANIMFSLDDGSITLPKSDEVPNDLELDTDASTANLANTKGTLIVAPFTEVNMIEQALVTDPINVNPYAFWSVEGTMALTPKADSWVDESNITIVNTSTYTYNTGRWWAHPGKDVSGGATQAWYNKNTNWDAKSQAAMAKKEKPWAASVSGTITTSGGTQVTDSQAQYMRVRTVTFDVEGLQPYADDLVLTFAGIKCSVTPATGYSAGSTVNGSIMAKGDGSAKGTFTIPSNVACGKVEVKVADEKNDAIASYTAEGINRTVADIIDTTYVTANMTDPLAESFQATMDAHITSVELKFAAKDNTVGCLVQLREMSNTGYPTSTVVGATYLQPSDINVSEDATAWTKVSFDDPISITEGQQLAIVIMSQSNNYMLWKATLGKNLWNTNTLLNNNPYIGVMFTSSNASTWSPDQSSDLAFRVNIAKYNTQPSIAVFEPMTNVSADEFILLATYLTPANTGCTWEYKLTTDGQTATLDSLPWQPIANYTLNSASGVITAVQLRATFKANDYVSPLLSISDLTFGTFTTALRGDYVSVNVDSSDSPYNQINLSYLEALPGNAAVIPQYSTDGGHTWIDFKANPTTTQYSSDYTQVKYVEALATEAKAIKLHLKMTTKNTFQRPRVASLACSWIDV